MNENNSTANFNVLIIVAKQDSHLTKSLQLLHQRMQ